MQLIVLSALVGLRIITRLMFAAAAGALAATVTVSLVPGSRPDWLQAVTVYAIASAVILGAGAVGTFMVMPARSELVRQLPADREVSLPVLLGLVLAALTGASVLQVPSLAAWWTADLRLAHEFIGTADPLGLYLIPTTLLVSTAFVATLAVLSFAIGGILALAAPQKLTFRVVTASLMTQGGLAGGLYTLDGALRRLGGAIQRFVDNASDPAASAGLADWLTRYELAPGSLRGRLLLLLGGFIFAAVLSRAMTRRAGSMEDAESDILELAPDGSSAPGPNLRPDEDFRPAESLNVPAYTSHFEDSTYSARPQSAWLGPWVSRRAAYDIASIPPTSRTQFSMSWQDEAGVVRHGPNGPEILSIAASSSGLFGGHSFEVRDAQTGLTIGALVPVGSDWEVRDASGRPVATVLQIDAALGRARFVAKAGEQEVCRFVWGWTGLTAASAELQIEFVPGAELRFDKALGIVLGVVLDHQARRANRWD